MRYCKLVAGVVLALALAAGGQIAFASSHASHTSKVKACRQLQQWHNNGKGVPAKLKRRVLSETGGTQLGSDIANWESDLATSAKATKTHKNGSKRALGLVNKLLADAHAVGSDCQSLGVSRVLGYSSTPTSAPSVPSATPPTTVPPGVGSTLTGTNNSGSTISLTLVRIADQITDTGQGAGFNNAQAGTRFLGMEFTIANASASSANYEGDINSVVVVVGSDNSSYEPNFSADTALSDDGDSDFNNGAYTIAPGTSVTGWVGFQLPLGVSVTKVEFGGTSLVWQPAPSSSSAPSSAPSGSLALSSIAEGSGGCSNGSTAIDNYCVPAAYILGPGQVCPSGTDTHNGFSAQVCEDTSHQYLLLPV